MRSRVFIALMLLPMLATSLVPWPAAARDERSDADLSVPASTGGGTRPDDLAPPETSATDALPHAPAVHLVPVIRGLSSPVFVTHAGDGSDRLFVVERAGRIRVFRAGVEMPTFLDITALVTAAGGEQGLLGLAFDPDFGASRRFYVYYTAANSRTGVGDNTIARFGTFPSDPRRANPATREILRAFPDRQTNHNGGMLAFGPDGYLYIGLGDEGGGGDPYGNAQNLLSPFGKILRWDVRPRRGYAIPPSNPFATRGDVRRDIWAFGLRNPWRFSFDRATGDLYTGDVGQSAFEEIDFQPARARGGTNYGWPRTEGLACYPTLGGSCDRAGVTLPVAQYAHSRGCSVTGGYVYRGAAVPSLRGAYVYGDFCSGLIWTLRSIAGRWVNTPLLESRLSISSFGEDETGELYLVDLNGAVYRFAPGS